MIVGTTTIIIRQYGNEAVEVMAFGKGDNGENIIDTKVIFL